MPSLSIESNGLLSQTTVYYNGLQVAGIRELLLNLDEEGTYECMIQYLGSDKQLHTKEIFSETIGNLQVAEPSLTEEEAAELRLLTVESDGDIESTSVFIDNEMAEGIVSLFVHIKSSAKNEGGLLSSVFSRRKNNGEAEPSVFTAEIEFRNEDDSIETEKVF